MSKCVCVCACVHAPEFVCVFLVIVAHGRVFSWGRADYGQLGLARTEEVQPVATTSLPKVVSTPSEIVGLKGICQVHHHITCLVSVLAAVLTWLLVFRRYLLQIACGSEHCCAVDGKQLLFMVFVTVIGVFTSQTKVLKLFGGKRYSIW